MKMTIHFLVALASLIIFLARLIKTRREHYQSNVILRYMHWGCIIVLCMAIVRLLDGRIIAETFGATLLLAMGLSMWFFNK